MKIYQYEFKTNEYADMNLLKGSHYGVLSNEIESVLPDITRKFRRITEDESVNDFHIHHFECHGGVKRFCIGFIFIICLLSFLFLSVSHGRFA